MWHENTDVSDRVSILLVRYGSGPTTSNSQCGCCSSCCGGALEQEHLDDTRELKRLQKESAELRKAAAVDSQPKATMSMSESLGDETKVDAR